MKTHVLLAAAAATASLVAACGGEGGGATPTPASRASQEAANRKAMLAYASCVRKHGVDMPDPQFNGGRVTMRAGGPGTDPDAMRVADKACGKYRDAVKAPEMSAAKQEAFKKAALANARCMRDHGIDMPDPTFDSNGGAQIRIGKGTGVDPQAPKFQKAQQACRSTMPGFGQTDAQDDGQ